MVLQEAEQEIEQVVGRILGDYRRSGRLDLEASETAVRAVMHKVGGSLLEKLLNAELGYRGAKVDCPNGHHAKFIQYRSKQLVTVLSDVSVERAELLPQSVPPKDLKVGCNFQGPESLERSDDTLHVSLFLGHEI